MSETSWRTVLASLDTPEKIQDFLNMLPFRPPKGRIVVRSPRAVLESGTASCMEGALLAAAALMARGEKPLLLDLQVDKNARDVDHVVALFRRDGRWGAVSKTSHAVLRYREPVYRTVRELAMSYFHEYFTDDGTKTLRRFSRPFDVRKHFGSDWIDEARDLYAIADALDAWPHDDMLPAAAAERLRKADPIEIAAGQIVDFE